MYVCMYVCMYVIPEPPATLQVLPPGEFNDMSSLSHVSHCMVLPLGKFTVMISEPNATLQGAVTWRNQCHDRATLQGVRISSAILKIVFRHILLFLFLLRDAMHKCKSAAYAIMRRVCVCHVRRLCQNE